MERPPAETQPKQREITGEIVYLDEMRRLNMVSKPYLDLSDMAIDMYECTADMFTGGNRPAIMDEYERYDPRPSEAIANCTALANELLKLKEARSPVTFVNIVVEESSDTVITKLKATAAGSLLATDDEQLAIESDGSYYPILDMRKQHATLEGVGLRVWGWEDDKYVFANEKGEQYTYPQHALVYPADEKSSTRQIDISFGYLDKDSRRFSETVSLYLSPNGSASLSRSIWASAYAETGYEGHHRSSLPDATDSDIAAFGDLIAEIVGDEPQSVAMNTHKQLQAVMDTASSPLARQAVEDLVEATWPAQAQYFLSRNLGDTGKTIAELLCDEATAEIATVAINTIVREWKAKR